MALKKDSLESLRVYKIVLVVFCGIAVVLPCLFGMTRFWTPLLSAVLVLFPAFCWKSAAVRGCFRVVNMLLTAAVPLLLLGLAVAGSLADEYAALLFFSALPLPAFALATLPDRKADIVLMRVAAGIHVVLSALLIYYIFPQNSWAKSVLFGATALVIAVLSVMIRPPVIGRKEKTDDC